MRLFFSIFMIVFFVSAGHAETVASVPKPRVALPDFTQEKHVKTRKERFFGYLRPIIENELAYIRHERERLLKIRQSGKALSKKDQRWLSSLRRKYKVSSTIGSDWDSLLKRVDTVPVELILAQAANESAWGTSRFAVQGNNLFGQWCYRAGCGMVPAQRLPGAAHEVAVFDSPADSVRAYLLNINRNKSYQRLRDIREIMRKQGQPLIAEALALGLHKYSERGKHYVKTIQKMIRVNRPLMLGRS